MTPALDSDLLQPGFRHIVLDSQSTFRAALTAMSRPGLPVTVEAELQPPAPLGLATAALALTLFDVDSPVWLAPAAAQPAVQAYLRFHCGCPLVAEPGAADFAVLTEMDVLPSLDQLRLGDDLYPDQSCTMIIQLPALDGGAPATLTGPGVNGTVQFAPSGLPTDFAIRWAANHARYPRGVDAYLACADRLVGLPRSVHWKG